MIEISDESSVHVVSDEHGRPFLCLQNLHTGTLYPVLHEEETPSVPETPRFDPAQGDPSPNDPAIGVATKIEAKDGTTQI